MIGGSLARTEQANALPAGPERQRFASRGHEPTVLADVYRDDVNIAIWQRRLSDPLRADIRALPHSRGPVRIAMTVSPASTLSSLSESLGTSRESNLCREIAELVEMFCDLFGLERAGLRLSELDDAMCPRFHVDMVPCRLITTYNGPGTDWLPHEAVNRAKLGAGSNGQSDLQSGLIRSAGDIEQLACGDVALLKGERWEGNSNAGLVHRSPAVAAGEKRLLLTLDFSS